MRRILFTLMSTFAAAVLLFGYRTSTPHPASVATKTVAAGSGGSSAGTGTTTTPAAPKISPTTAAGPGTAAAPTTSTPTTASTPTTVSGQAVQTRWGPVQVQITVASRRITDVMVLQQPSGNDRDARINAVALPVLKQETLQAQSAQIDSVSGATYTSDGYLGSLQSALAAAGL